MDLVNIGYKSHNTILYVVFFLQIWVKIMNDIILTSDGVWSNELYFISIKYEIINKIQTICN